MIIANKESFKELYPFSKDENGQKSWVSMPNDEYVATGIDIKGRRFKIVSSSWRHIAGINIYRGTKWLLRYGKKWKVQEIFN